MAIARALASKPAIILADEPTGNLDSKTSQDILGLLKTTSKKFNQTIVIITHNEEIAQLADRVVCIEDGKEIVIPMVFNICGYYKAVIPHSSNYGEIFTNIDFIEKYNYQLPKGLNKIHIQTNCSYGISSTSITYYIYIIKQTHNKRSYCGSIEGIEKG